MSEKVHRCLRCYEEFPCPHDPNCAAEYSVLPRIVNASGELTEHCPLAPDWDWVRAYGERMRAAAHIEAARVYARAAKRTALTPADTERLVRLEKALEVTARNLHEVGGYHNPKSTPFEKCQRASCVTARGALEGKHE